MRRYRRSLLLLAVMVATSLGCAARTYTPSHEASAPPDPRAALTNGMRKLWADHVVWTRQYIIAATNDTADVQPTTDRLLKNQDEIGAAIAPYYGADAGRKLTDLLKQHILIAVDLVSAAKANDQVKRQDADRRGTRTLPTLPHFSAGPIRTGIARRFWAC